MPSYDAQREEVYEIASSGVPGEQGPIATPDLIQSGPKGGTSRIDLERRPLGRVMVRLRKPVADVAIMEVDIYPAAPGTPLMTDRPMLEALVLCPRCRHQLRIGCDRKRIDFDPTRNLADGGRLSIEPFQCTWELEDFRGSGMCHYRVAIDNNVAIEA